MATGEFDFEAVRQALAREIERSGIPPTTLSQRISKTNKGLVKNILEDGSDIKLSTLASLADELGINIADLVPWARPAPQAFNAEQLEPLLDALLPILPKPGKMTEQSRRAVAEALAYGLQLLGGPTAMPASDDAVAVAARAAVSRFRDLMN